MHETTSSLRTVKLCVEVSKRSLRQQMLCPRLESRTDSCPSPLNMWSVCRSKSSCPLSAADADVVLREANKTYNVMRFSKALNVDVKTWTRHSVRLERESSLRSDVKVADGDTESVSKGERAADALMTLLTLTGAAIWSREVSCFCWRRT